MDTNEIAMYYEKYGPMVFRRCQFILKNEEKAYDCLQEVFMQIIKKKEDLNIQYPSTFLLKTATNLCLNVIRREQKIKMVGEESVLFSIEDESNQEQKIISQDFIDRIFKEEDELTHKILLLYYIDGKTLNETSEESEVSVSTIQKVLNNIKRKYPYFKEWLNN